MPVQAYFQSTVAEFLERDDANILGVLASQHRLSLEEEQRRAWAREISVLRASLDRQVHGNILFECYIPRMGKRSDVVLILRGLLFVVEFKVGAIQYGSAALDQVVDYALDFKNFHEGSHTAPIIPVLVATNAPSHPIESPKFSSDQVAEPLKSNSTDLRNVIGHVIASSLFSDIDFENWRQAGYRPTPTIVEAAKMLYKTHNVADISRSDAGAKNLAQTNETVSSIIDDARSSHKKAICFVTGVPGSGKTLAGLNIATRRSEEHKEEHTVFLSGNGPLVDVLREALARDKACRDSVPKKDALRKVRSFVQNIHHFRDQYLSNTETPVEKVVVFDEAQRAWTQPQTAGFMRRRRGIEDFDMSEPEFLISVMDRHPDWCTVVCLIGDGQEINTGEAGISEWIRALKTRFTYYLEDVASEFAVQGLELDWVGVCWDGDLHHNGQRWMSQSFKGTKWQAVSDENRQTYLKNAYRVLLTRARQGMIIFVPHGNPNDPTRPVAFYDHTFQFLRSCGIESIP